MAAISANQREKKAKEPIESGIIDEEKRVSREEREKTERRRMEEK